MANENQKLSDHELAAVSGGIKFIPPEDIVRSNMYSRITSLQPDLSHGAYFYEGDESDTAWETLWNFTTQNLDGPYIAAYYGDIECRQAGAAGGTTISRGFAIIDPDGNPISDVPAVQSYMLNNFS